MFKDLIDGSIWYEVCDGKFENGELVGVKESAKDPIGISEEKFERLTAFLKDYYLYVEGSHTSSYDNSDDERASSYSSDSKFGYYYEINPKKNSKYLLRINEEIKGVVFFVKNNRGDFTYYPYLFDGSIRHTIRLGYSASHSSSYTYIEKISLVKKDDPNAPKEAREISFQQSEMYPSM